MPVDSPMPQDSVRFGGHPDRARLCLRVCGDDLDPDEITRILGRASTRSQRKGQPVMSESGVMRRIARTGSWLLDQPVRGDSTIEEEIDTLLGSLPPEGQAWSTIGERYCVDLLCDVSVRGVNQGFEIEPRVMEMLAKRGITLGVDIFCVPDEQQQKALQERLVSTAKVHRSG